MAITATPGHPDGSSALAAIASIKRAVSDVFEGRAGAIVTNPVSKDVLYRSGFADPGHTEYLARIAREHTGNAVMPVMMLWCEELKAIPVTIHIPLKDVPAKLTTALIVETGRVAARDLAARFRHRAAAPRDLGPQSACRRELLARRGRSDDHQAGGRDSCGRKASTPSDRLPPTRFFIRKRGPAMMSRSACSTIRR